MTYIVICLKEPLQNRSGLYYYKPISTEEEKKMQLVKNEEVKITFLTWINEPRSKTRTFVAEILQKKDEIFADALSVDEFLQGPSGWLQKDRPGMVCKKVCGKKG